MFFLKEQCFCLFVLRLLWNFWLCRRNFLNSTSCSKSEHESLKRKSGGEGNSDHKSIDFDLYRELDSLGRVI